MSIQHGSLPPPEPAQLIIYVYQGIRKIGPVRDSYTATVILCQDMFPALNSAPNIGLYTKDLDICHGQQAEIYAESWKDVVGQIKEIVIIDQIRNVTIQDDTNCISTGIGSNRVFVNTSKGTRITFNVDFLTSTVGDLMSQIAAVDGTPVGHQRLMFDGNRLAESHTLRHYNIGDESSLDLLTGMRGRKPVIYLFAQVAVDASVGLSLVPQWSLSAIYPVTTNIKSGVAGTDQCVSWRVRVHPEGHLTELSTGLDIAYLYWEALTNPPVPSSPPASPLLGHAESVNKVQAFDPTNASLNDQNSVVISVDKVTPYLDAALKALGLHIEARTSFITYWLPSLVEHKHIAFRFLPQASYEQAAPLDISPTPDIVTRIFMVFKGIDDSELELWPVARKRVNDDVSAWIDIVGVDVGRTVDKSLFRVIEWGGMEVSRSETPAQLL